MAEISMDSLRVNVERALKDQGVSSAAIDQLLEEIRDSVWLALLQEKADEDLFAALIDDFEYGNCPGSKLKVGNQEIWLYTEQNVTGWLRAAQKARKAGVPS